MKKLLLVFTCLSYYASFAQYKEDQFFVYDRDWHNTTLSKAVYFLRVRQTGEKNFLWTTYNMFGPMISEENFQDEAGNIPNGKCTYYNSNGFRDSTGRYANGLRDGKWYFLYNEYTRVKEYEKGVLVKDTSFSISRDSVFVAYKQPVREESFAATGLESGFKGGKQGWAKFLNRNIVYPKRAADAHISGMVVLQFVVDEDGKVLNPEIERSVEYSLDEEALRVIKKSPDWLPALKDEKFVRSYKKQPIIYALSNW